MSEFKNLGLNDLLVQATEALGFTSPTPVQQNTIPLLLSGEAQDLISLAQTGTGKTAAFGLPLLHLIDTDKRDLQGIIICPTRELCLQVSGDLENYGKFLPNFRLASVYGGSSYTKQLKELKDGVQVIVATPGRLVDLLQRGVVQVSTVKRIVLDEADEMLNMGFQEAIDSILDSMTNKETIWLFSATMPAEVRRIASRYMKAPYELKSGSPNESAKNIEHVYYVCRGSDKYATLKRVVDAYPNIFGIIFCRTKMETQEIAEQMTRDGYNSAALHGDLSQNEREKVMGRFRGRVLQLLIATDVAARGIDVSDITHVINYSLPDEPEVYTHRSGRTARAGKFGISIALITARDEQKLFRIEKMTKSKFERKPIPTATDICKTQVMNIIQNIHDVEVMTSEIEPYLDEMYAALQDVTKEELIQRLASVEFNRFLEYYKDAPDLNQSGARREKREGGMTSDRPERSSNSNMTRLFINVGELDGASKQSFLRLLCDETGITSASVGKIDISRIYTHFDVETPHVENVMKVMSSITINGRSVRMDIAAERSSGGGSDRPRRSYNDDDRGGRSGGRFSDSKGGGRSYGGGGERRKGY